MNKRERTGENNRHSGTCEKWNSTETVGEQMKGENNRREDRQTVNEVQSGQWGNTGQHL